MTDLQYFSELKKEMLRHFCEAYPTWSGGLKGFGVREIAQFQNLLQDKTGGRVSEKWFYTHLKKDHDKLPRIDVLDLLSQFVNHENWGAFKSAVQSQHPKIKGRTKKGRWKKFAWVATGSLTFFSLVIFLSSLTFGKAKKYEVCFVDAMTQKVLEEEKVKIEFFLENESPKIFITNEAACHGFEVEGDKIKFVVKAEYYRRDTIVRILRQQKQIEKIALQRDDYAWLIHVFSTGKIKDWEERRQQLKRMIANDAMIFQVDVENGRPMELFTKREFITKLTLPLSSLGELEVLQTKYDATGKIRSMHFYQKED